MFLEDEDQYLQLKVRHSSTNLHPWQASDTVQSHNLIVSGGGLGLSVRVVFYSQCLATLNFAPGYVWSAGIWQSSGRRLFQFTSKIQYIVCRTRDKSIRTLYSKKILRSINIILKSLSSLIFERVYLILLYQGFHNQGWIYFNFQILKLSS